MQYAAIMHIYFIIEFFLGVLRNVQKQVKKLVSKWRPPTQVELENMKKWYVCVLCVYVFVLYLLHQILTFY